MYSGGACTELPWHEPLPMPLHQHLRAFHRFRRGQGKHDFAVHMQGACSHRCCVESPRASGQRVPAGDRTATALACVVRPLVEPPCQVVAICISTAMSRVPMDGL